MVENYGDGQVRIPIIWCLASALSHVFASVTKPKLFPLLWVTGSMGSGKNTLINHCLSFVGITGFEGFSITQATEASIWKMLASLSSIPVWIDELRDDRKGEQMAGVWRSVYNRSVTAKSKMNSDVDLVSDCVKGTLILSGQDITGDTALNQRFIPIEVSKVKRKGHKYKWINKNCGKFSSAIIDIYNDYDKHESFIRRNYHDHKDRINTIVCDDRISANIAVVTTMAESLGIDLYRDFDFDEWVVNVQQSILDTSDTESFFDSVLRHLQENPNDADLMFSNAESELFMSISSAYKVYKEDNKGKEILSKRALISEMENSGISKYKFRGRVKDIHNMSVQMRGVILRKNKIPKELLDYLYNLRIYRPTMRD